MDLRHRYRSDDSANIAQGVYDCKMELDEIKKKMTGDIGDLNRKLHKIVKKLEKLTADESTDTAEEDYFIEEDDGTIKEYIGHPPINTDLGMEYVCLSGLEETTSASSIDDIDDEGYEQQKLDFKRLVKMSCTTYRASEHFLNTNDSDYYDHDVTENEDDNVQNYIGGKVDQSVLNKDSYWKEEDEEDKYKYDLGLKKVWEVPHEGQRKYHVVVYEEDDWFKVIMKGDINVILPLCTRMEKKGKEEPLHDDQKEKLKKLVLKDLSDSYPQKPLAYAHKTISKETYPDGFPSLPTTQENCHKICQDLCYAGFVSFELSCDWQGKEFLKSEDERFIFITGNHPLTAEKIEDRTLKMSRGYFRAGKESLEEAAARHDISAYRMKKSYDLDVIVDCDDMRDFTRDDLEEMMFGTRTLILANANPLLKVTMVTTCIAMGIPPVVTSHLSITGEELSEAKTAADKCRKVGIKSILLTSAEGDEARAQALQYGVFTKKTKTIDDIARRLGVSVEEIRPREAKSRIVQNSEIRKIKRKDLFEMQRKYSELVFSGLTNAEKYHLRDVNTNSNTIYLFVIC